MNSGRAKRSLPDEQAARLLDEMTRVATTLRRDTGTLGARMAREIERFRAGETDLEDASFWVKHHAAAQASFAAGFSYYLRHAALEHSSAAGLELPQKARRELEANFPRTPTRSIAVGFRRFAALFGLVHDVDTQSAEFRELQALFLARDRFTHPKQPEDLVPVELLRSHWIGTEWFLREQIRLQVACSRAAGIDPGPVALRPPRNTWSRARLEGFSRLKQVVEGCHGQEGSAAWVDDFMSSLERDTHDTFHLLVRDASCQESGLRALLRAFFWEFEGVVSIGLRRACQNTSETEIAQALTGPDAQVLDRAISIVEAASRGPTIERSGPGWDALIRSRQRRNLVAHPKSPGDLYVGEQGKRDLALAILWFRTTATNRPGFAPDALLPGTTQTAPESAA
jgi:hypothetical protein